MAALTDIIERLEKATGPLGDADVAELLAIRDGKKVKNWAIATGDAGEDEMQVYCTDGTTIRASKIHEYPDRSVDAALTLKPDGWEFVLWTENGLVEAYPTKGIKRPAGIKFRAQGHDLPLAICIVVFKIAALKARTA